jgi:hypothetical protein
MRYEEFIERKSQLDGNHGFAPVWMPEWLFDFQSALVEWAVRKGRAAIFADCGLGKGPMSLVWAENVARRTGGRVLILTPIAVGPQLEREAMKFGIGAEVARDGRPHGAITITNYEQLHRFDPADFVGAVCDESSILKAFDGTRRAEITRFLRKLPYRLLCTATAAPNDYTELGTSSEALGYLGHMDMLGRFFVNDLKNSYTGGRHHGEQVKWRLKGHAEGPFWRWVCSWARAIRHPSDLGFTDGAFTLPPIAERVHVVETAAPPEGYLFARPAEGLHELRDEVRRTLRERCERAAALVRDTGEPAVVWANLNAEADLLERLIPDAVQVAGAHSDAEKERRLVDFAEGRTRVLVTKPKVGAFGLNWQHCAHVVSLPTYSYEAHYQGVRRCWRFGQTRPVRVDLVVSEGQRDVLEALGRKAAQADAMFSRLVAAMGAALHVERAARHEQEVEMPSWL